MTGDIEKCLLSILTGIRAKWANFRENICAFLQDKRNCPLYAVVRRVNFHCITYLSKELDQVAHSLNPHHHQMDHIPTHLSLLLWHHQ